MHPNLEYYQNTKIQRTISVHVLAVACRQEWCSKNPPVLNLGYWLAKADLYIGCKTVTYSENTYKRTTDCSL